MQQHHQFTTRQQMKNQASDIAVYLFQCAILHFIINFILCYFFYNHTNINYLFWLFSNSFLVQRILKQNVSRETFLIFCYENFQSLARMSL